MTRLYYPLWSLVVALQCVFVSAIPTQGMAVFSLQFLPQQRPSLSCLINVLLGHDQAETYCMFGPLTVTVHNVVAIFGTSPEMEMLYRRAPQNEL